MDNKQQNFNTQPPPMSQPYQPPAGPVNSQQLPSQPYNYSDNQQTGYQMPSTSTDQKVPFTNDVKQPGVLPGYGAQSSGLTPMQKEQQQVQQQIQQAKSSGGYPGVVGGTPAESKGVTGYDAQGNPIIPAFIAQRHQVEQSLGPTCKDGGYHDLRMLLSNSSLLFAVLIIPYCCGYRGRRVCTCTKCKQKFPNIVLPSA